MKFNFKTGAQQNITGFRAYKKSSRHLQHIKNHMAAKFIACSALVASAAAYMPSMVRIWISILHSRLCFILEKAR